MQTVVIERYTRSQAIEDGELIDVSHLARKLGFCAPVAITRAVWTDCVEASELAHGRQHDHASRLWNVLCFAHAALDRQTTGAYWHDRILYNAMRVTLDVVIYTGDSGEPVVTIMEIGEG